MASCRRRVVFLLLSTLFFQEICFAKGDADNDAFPEANQALRRSKRAPPNIPPGRPDAQAMPRMGADGGKVPDPLPGVGNQLNNQQQFNQQQNQFGQPFVQGQGIPQQPQKGIPPGVGVDVPNLGKDGQQKTRASKIKISESVQCAGDVLKFCSKGVKDNNFSILDCLQSDERTNDDVSEACQHFLWEYKHDLTKDDRFDIASGEVCAKELRDIPECEALQPGAGLIIPCLIEHYMNISTKTCQSFLNKMASIIFSDYRFIYHFAENCKDDILTLKCGRLSSNNDDAPHSQGHTVECLAQKMPDLSEQCKKQVLRVYELQSDDFHLDRPLYYACHYDREHLCGEVKSGNGAVFQCLFDHLGSKDLSAMCREKLELRQRLIAEDVRVEHTFYMRCEKDIKENNCLAGQMGHEDVKRAHVLLCLESAHMNERPVAPECIQEMLKVRTRLIEDYRVNPDLMARCSHEIETECNGLAPGGDTLHCLMKLARDRKSRSRMRPECNAELGRLLKEANVMEDYRIDKPLQLACASAVTALCAHVPPGPGGIINCLMDNIDEEEMTPLCEDRLLEIQFFVARDFTMDPDMFKSCKRDAKRYCHEHGDWADNEVGVESGPLVLACLRRHYRHHLNDEKVPQLSRACIVSVERVMRQRAMSMDLNPEIEQACLSDLGLHCSEDEDDTQKGAEIECLQLNFENLKPQCKEAIGNFTEEEYENLRMDRILLKACTPMIKKFCEEELDDESEADEVLECLIDHKNNKDMDAKCAAGVEHHQLISLKDFRFNRKFKEACHKSVQTFCKNKLTKYDVVSCLSEHVRNDTLLEQKQRVEQTCRRQLKVELLQREEDINLDPELKKECSQDIKQFCTNIKAGNAETLECLKKNQRNLGKSCHQLLFKREKDEFAIADYAVAHSCKKMIKQFCDPESDEPEILECLKREKDRDDFDMKCRRIVQQRQIAQARDYRLNPLLQKGCQQDIPKFCGEVLHDEHNDEELEGKVIDCLKKQYAQKRLSKDCEHQVRGKVREAALDINLNPVLFKACKHEINDQCREFVEFEDVHKQVLGDVDNMNIKESGRGQIVECLKAKFAARKLKDQACIKEVAMLVSESHVDVNVDPILDRACQQDLMTLCRQVPRGEGRQMSCLLSFLDEDPNSMTQQCRFLLTKRKEMWEYAAQVAPPEDFGEIYESVMSSPSRNYFLAILFTVVGIIFIVGISCGRVTKRVRAELKNK